MGSKMGPSYASPFSYVLSDTKFFLKFFFLKIFSSTRKELTKFITAVNSFHPALKFTWEISDTSSAFLDTKFQLKATVYALVFSANLQIHIVTSCIHLRIQHTSRIPYLFHIFSDFVVYAAMTLIFPKNQWQGASFSINVYPVCGSSGPLPCPTNWSTVSTTNGWEGKHWWHSIHSHISPSQPRG